MTKTEIKAMNRVAFLTRMVKDTERAIRDSDRHHLYLDKWRGDLIDYKSRLQAAKKEYRRAQQWRLDHERIHNDPKMVAARKEIKNAQQTLMDTLKKLTDGKIEPDEAWGIASAFNKRFAKGLQART